MNKPLTLFSAIVFGTLIGGTAVASPDDITMDVVDPSVDSVGDVTRNIEIREEHRNPEADEHAQDADHRKDDSNDAYDDRNEHHDEMDDGRDDSKDEMDDSRDDSKDEMDDSRDDSKDEMDDSRDDMQDGRGSDDS